MGAVQKLFKEYLQSCDELVNAKACVLIKEGKEALFIFKSWEIIKNVPRNLEKMKYNLRRELPFKAAQSRQKEIDADFLAISLTKDKNSAISCLEKLLAYDNEMGFSKEIILTMQQRIDEIK